MTSPLPPWPPRPSARLQSLSELSASAAQRLLAAAQAIRRAGVSVPRLRGRHVAVLCEAPHSASADAFAAAALALGAAVVRLQPSALRLTGRQAGRDTASALGRLYGAIGCDGVAPSVLGLLVRWSGVPVFNAVAASTHPLWRLAEQWSVLELDPAAAASPPTSPPTSPPASTPGQRLPQRTQQALRVANHGYLLQAWLSDCIA